MNNGDLLIYDSLVRSTVGEYLRGKSHRLQNDKQDMIQECLLRLWSNAEKIDMRRNPREYVRRMTRNTCIDYERKFRQDAISDAVSVDEDNDE